MTDLTSDQHAAIEGHEGISVLRGGGGPRAWNGIRYKTGFGPLRLDVGTPLNRRPGDGRITVSVALGQAF